jgi:hypothetical protein
MVDVTIRIQVIQNFPRTKQLGVRDIPTLSERLSLQVVGEPDFQKRFIPPSNGFSVFLCRIAHKIYSHLEV